MMKTLPRPCASCPWVKTNRASDIPRFVMKLAEGLANTCASRGFGPGIDAPQFACHQSTDKENIPCAGWLAVEGRNHAAVRWNVSLGHYPRDVLNIKVDWPELHGNYEEMMEKLRRT